MGRHRIRSFLSSIFKDHLDSDNHGWLEEHRKEIEDKVKKILELVDEEKEGNPNEEEELTGLIHDFYKYYQVLHERYDQLAGDLKKNVNGRERNDASSSSSSSSDSETEKSGRNDKHRKHHKSGEVNKDREDQHENLKQELRASQDAENDMKQKFMSITEEKNSLLLQNANALDRLNVADKKVEELVVLSEQWNKDKLLLDADISDLNLQLETERKLVSNLESSLEATGKEKTELSLLSEQWNKDRLLSDSEISDLKLQLETERKLVANLQSSLEAADKLKNELSLSSEQWNKDKLLSDSEISDLKFQLETERKLVANLKSSLEATDKEKNELSLEIISALRKAEDMQKTVDNLEGEVKVLKGENVKLLSNIESHKQENTVTMDSLQQAHKTIEDYSSEMEKLAYENSAFRADKEAVGKEISNINESLTATYRERDVLVSDQLSMTGKLEDAERIIEELKKEIQLLKLGLSERDSINDNLQKELEVAGQKIDTQSQLLLLAEESKNKLILENSEAATKLEHAEINLREAHEKAQLLMEENVMFQQRHDDLEGKVRELENRLMKKEEEISDLQRKYEVEKKEAFGQIDDLKIQINEHQLQHSSLSTVTRELEEQIEIGKNEAHEKHKQTESLKEELTGKIRKLEQKYEDREKEVSNLITLLEEARSKASEQIDDLQSKHSLLSSQKQEAEGKMETVEKELTGKILELEKLLEEKEEMCRISDENHKQLEAKFQKSCDELQEAESKRREVEESLRMLRLEVTGLTMEMASVAAQKNELEDNFEKAKNELSELEFQKEKLYHELQSKISNHEIMVQERDNRLSESEMKYKQLEDQVFDVSEKLKSAEQRIEELEEDRLKIEAAKDVIIQNLQVSIEEMTREVQLLMEENVMSQQRHDDLEGKVRELENRLMKKEEEISDLQRKYEVEKKEAFGQIDDLNIQINEHQLQHSSLSTVKRELEEQIEIGKNEAREKHKQMESLKEELTGKIRKLEQKYEDREKEVSNLIAVLEEARSKASEQIDDLQSKHSLLSSQKQEAEGKMETIEKDLTGKILELEKLLEEKEEMCRISDENHKQLEAKLQKSCDELQEAESKRREVEESLRMLRLEVTGLTMEMASVAALKNELEDNFEKAKNELSELEFQKEKLYHELQSKISNHEIMVQERDNRLSESEMKYKQLEDQVFDVSEKLKSAEQRIEELEEDRLKIEAAKDVIIQNLQVSIEEMTRDIKTSEEEINGLKGEVSKHIEDYKLLQISAEEEKAAASTKMDALQQLNDDQKEEIAKLQESLQGAEVQLRLSTRKLQITESEFEKNLEFFRRKEEEMLEKHKSLEEQVSLSSKKITTLENEKKEMHGTTTVALKSLNAEFGNLISAIQRLDEYHYQTHLRLSEFSRELQVVKKSLSDIKSHKQVLRGEIQDLTEKLVDTGRSKYLLEKKLGLVETTMKETASENNKLMESVANYVKKMGEIEMEVRKREVEMAEKNEEKREAIRQLCIYIEYYRENHDIVKESLLKMLTRTRRSA